MDWWDIGVWYSPSLLTAGFSVHYSDDFERKDKSIHSKTIMSGARFMQMIIM